MWEYQLRDDNSEVMSANYLLTSSMPTSNLCLLLENKAKKSGKVLSLVAAFDYLTFWNTAFVFFLYRGICT